MSNPALDDHVFYSAVAEAELAACKTYRTARGAGMARSSSLFGCVSLPHTIRNPAMTKAAVVQIKFASLMCAVAAPLLAPVAVHAQAFKLLHSFGTGTDGALPGNVGLLNVNGALYGTTEEGGSSNKGTIFAIDPFGSSNGALVHGAVIKVGSRLYGTTTYGGINNEGTVFSAKP